MRLVELEPEWLQWLDATHWRMVPAIAEATGISFLCPRCFETNAGPVGTHRIICWSRSRGVPDGAEPGPGRWQLLGSSFEDLTLDAEPGKSRSILLTSGCSWHGYITAGAVTHA
jgi:hypothetical protein